MISHNKICTHLNDLTFVETTYLRCYANLLDTTAAYSQEKTLGTTKDLQYALCQFREALDNLKKESDKVQAIVDSTVDGYMGYK